MQAGELPTRIKKIFRPIIAAAHEAELRRALESLRSEVGEWRAGKIDSFELANRIHAFHNGPNRDIHVRFTSRLDPRVLVQHALEEGLIRKASVPKEIWPYLDGFTSVHRCSES
jgi:hypothetical protein